VHQPQDASSGFVKIVIPLDADAWHGHATESVWATEVGNGKYRIENVPFYAMELSFGDVVRAAPKDGSLQFDCVASRGGHSTYRVITRDGADDSQVRSALSDLNSNGASYERDTANLLAVDIPKVTDVPRIYRILEDKEKTGVWDFEEGHYFRA
jgi:hypothetical protein